MDPSADPLCLFYQWQRIKSQHQKHCKRNLSHQINTDFKQKAIINLMSLTASFIIGSALFYVRPPTYLLIFTDSTVCFFVFLPTAWMELHLCPDWSNSSISVRAGGLEPCSPANRLQETSARRHRNRQREGAEVINDDRWSSVEWQNRETNSVWNAHLSAAVARVL